MVDPSRNLDDLMHDFTWGYYGQAAPAMEEYDKLLSKRAKKYQLIMDGKEEGITFNMNNPLLSKEFLDRATELFDEAEKLAEDDDVLRRVRKTRLSIMYVRLALGPEFVGDNYGDILEKFKKVGREVGVTHLAENWQKSDFEEKIALWEKQWQEYSKLKTAKK